MGDSHELVILHVVVLVISAMLSLSYSHDKAFLREQTPTTEESNPSLARLSIKSIAVDVAVAVVSAIRLYPCEKHQTWLIFDTEN